MLWVGVLGLLLSAWLTSVQAQAQNLAIPKYSFLSPTRIKVG